MAPAEKNTSVGWLLSQYVRWQVRLHFHTVLIRGLEFVENLPTDRPVIVFSNHTNWWDGFLVFLLTRSARRKHFYCMMDENQLRRHPFLSRLGAFSIDLENSLRTAGAVRYAVRLLQKKSTLLWIFPQGEMTSPHKTIEMRSGVNYLATQANGALMLPVAFRYEFFKESKPHVLIEVGQPFPALESSDERIEAACVEVVAGLNNVVTTQNIKGFEELLTQPQPLVKKLELFLESLQHRFGRFKTAL